MDQGVVVRPKKIGSFTLKNVEDVNVQKFTNNKERIITYVKIGNQITVLRNCEYKRRLKKKYLESSKNLLKLEVYSGLVKDLQKRAKELQRILIETNEETIKTQPRIDKEIQFYRDQIVNGELRREAFKDFPAMKKDADEELTSLLLNIFDDEKWLKDIIQKKEYEKAKTKERYEAEKLVESSKTIIKYYEKLGKIFKAGKIESTKSKCNILAARLDEMQKFIFEINEKGNIIETDTGIDQAEIEEKIDGLLNYFKEFTEAYIESYNLNLKINSYIKAIELENRFWNETIKVRVEETAEEYLIEIHNYYIKLRDKAQNRLKVENSRDDISHMQEGVLCMNKNIDGVKDSINNMRIKGSIKVGSDEITHNLKVANKTAQLTPFFIDNVPQSTSSALAAEYLKQIKRGIEFVEEEMALLGKFRANLVLIEEKIKENGSDPKEKTEKKTNELNIVNSKYIKLKEFVYRPEIKLNSASLYSIFGVLIQNLSIKVKRSWTRSGSEFQNTDINPIDIYKSTLHKMKKKNNSVSCCSYFCGKTPCYGAMNTIFDKNNLDFKDIISILFKNKILGSLKNSNGQAQEKFLNFRSEDVNESLFKCFKGCLEVLVWFEMETLKINSEYNLQKIHEVQNYHSKLMEDHKYLDLTKKLVTFKFK